MLTITEKKQCSGCFACASVCPVNCIEMKTDSEGFWYPQIDTAKCKNCGLCEKVCKMRLQVKKNPKGTAYACINTDETVRRKSSSGGVFTLIAEYVIKKGGVVFGAAFDEDWNVKHIAVSKTEDLEKLRGSKYLQSKIGTSYTEAKKYLEEGRLVLFTGTPCQIAGLSAFLGKKYENLILQDLICHGVPSPKVWQIYLQERKSAACSTFRRKSKPDFRRKAKGWLRFSLSLPFDNESEYQETLDKDTYMKVFLSNLSLRPSCYDCQTKSLERQSDITLADYWGVKDLEPEMFDDKGTSLVFVHSQKGEELFRAVSESVKWKKTDIDKAVLYNSSAVESVKEPKNRTAFFKELGQGSFDELANRMTRTPLWKKGLRFMKRVIKKVVKIEK